MKPLEKVFVVRWWSRSAVTFKEDITLNPTEFKELLFASGDAVSVNVWSVSELMEFHDAKFWDQEE